MFLPKVFCSRFSATAEGFPMLDHSAKEVFKEVASEASRCVNWGWAWKTHEKMVIAVF